MSLAPQDRIKMVPYKGKKVLVLDFSYASLEDITAAIDYAVKGISEAPKKSLLTLTIVTGVKAEADVFNTLSTFAEKNASMVKAGAVVGVEGVRAKLLEALNTATHRNLRSFDDAVKAKAWLITQ